MKNPLLRKIQQAPRLRKVDFWLTLLPALYWLAALNARPWVIRTYCVAKPTPCTPEQVLAIDRPSIGMESGDADGFSLITQNTSGIVAATIPMIWSGAQILNGSLSPAAAAMALGTDLVILSQTMAWNGAFTETARLLVQRPRPFVFADPSRANDPQNYTSFYSGHTSFSSTSVTGLLLILIGHGAPSWLLILTGVGAQALVISTAVFRIMAGRHFLTDTLTGAAMGALVALAVAILHRPAGKD